MPEAPAYHVAIWKFKKYSIIFNLASLEYLNGDLIPAGAMRLLLGDSGAKRKVHFHNSNQGTTWAASFKNEAASYAGPTNF